MNAFDRGRAVEAEGLEVLLPFLRQHAFQGQFTVINKGPLAEMLQQTIGDAVFNRNGKIWALEIKTEKANDYGNFYLETWSNKNWNLASSVGCIRC